jgi:hypothetical protein
LGSALGLFSSGVKVELRFAQRHARIRAQILERVLPHHVQPLHGLRVCSALQNHRVCIGLLVHRARLLRPALRKSGAGK